MSLRALLRKQWFFVYAMWPLPFWVVPNGRCGPMPFQPCVDGDLLPLAPLEAVAAGCDKEVMVGYNFEEWNLLLPPGPQGMRVPLREARVLRSIAGNLDQYRFDLRDPEAAAAAVLNALRRERPGVSNGRALMDFYTAHILGIPSVT